MIEKKDWEAALEQRRNMLVNALVNIEATKFAVGECERKIAEFPEEKEEVPEEVKEIVKAVK